MSSVNRWQKYFKEAIGEDLRKENELPLSLTDVAKLRGLSLIDALTNLYLGPLFPLYVTSPSFKKEVDIATQILPNVGGLVLNEKNLPIIKKMMQLYMPKDYDYSTHNARTAWAFIKAKYPKLASIVYGEPIYVERLPGGFTGSFDPHFNMINLSVESPDKAPYYYAKTIAHELMHALQQKRNPLRFMAHTKYSQKMKQLILSLIAGDINRDQFYREHNKFPEEIEAIRAGNTALNAYLKFLDMLDQLNK